MYHLPRSFCFAAKVPAFTDFRMVLGLMPVALLQSVSVKMYHSISGGLSALFSGLWKMWIFNTKPYRKLKIFHNTM